METKLITIYSTTSKKEADFIVDLLVNEKIEPFVSLSDDNKTSLIQVKENEVEKAVKILIKYSKQLERKKASENIRGKLNLLVPIDFSYYSIEACRFAFSIAEKFDGDIELLHVYEDPFQTLPGVKYTKAYIDYTARILQENETKAKKDLSAFSDELKSMIQQEELPDVPYHFSLVKGRPSNKIVSVAAETKPNLIIMGHRGKGAIDSSLGSVTLKVVENTNIPVLAIPVPCDFTSLYNINVLYATNFHERDNSSFEKLLEILEPFHVNYYLVHVQTEDIAGYRSEKLDALEQQLIEQYNIKDLECHLLSNDDFFEALQRFIIEKDIKLLSFTSPRRSIFYKILKPNNLKRIIHNMEIPMLIFRV